jgi:hypothetical protein
MATPFKPSQVRNRDPLPSAKLMSVFTATNYKQQVFSSKSDWRVSYLSHTSAPSIAEHIRFE